jgi:hypothetical protein
LPEDGRSRSLVRCRFRFPLNDYRVIETALYDSPGANHDRRPRSRQETEMNKRTLIAMAQTVRPFLDGKSGAKSWDEQVKEGQ